MAVREPEIGQRRMRAVEHPAAWPSHRARHRSTSCAPTASQRGRGPAKRSSITHWLNGSVITAASIAQAVKRFGNLGAVRVPWWRERCGRPWSRGRCIRASNQPSSAGSCSVQIFAHQPRQLRAVVGQIVAATAASARAALHRGGGAGRRRG